MKSIKHFKWHELSKVLPLQEIIWLEHKRQSTLTKRYCSQRWATERHSCDEESPPTGMWNRRRGGLELLQARFTLFPIPFTSIAARWRLHDTHWSMVGFRRKASKKECRRYARQIINPLVQWRCRDIFIFSL